jgi:hypothetical protein
VITIVIAQLFANMASQKKSTEIVGEEEIVMDIYADSLSDIFDGESEDCLQFGSALVEIVCNLVVHLLMKRNQVQVAVDAMEME